MLLGAHLRRLREAQGISREDAGWEIRSSASKISRMELGRVGFKERDVDDLLTLYGVNDRDERAGLMAKAREANSPGWWHRDGDILPSWFHSYLGMEAAAALIRSYEGQFIPGLLQTADYARAVILLGHASASSAEIDRRVALRMKRQELLKQKNPPRVWCVIDEAALRRPVGGVDVMRGQITALIEASKRRNIKIQVVPFAAGGHAAASGSFTILRFPEQDLPDVVYIEQLTSALYLDKREETEFYAEVMDRLGIEAEQPARTPDILTGILHDFGEKRPGERDADTAASSATHNGRTAERATRS